MSWCYPGYADQALIIPPSAQLIPRDHVEPFIWCIVDDRIELAGFDGGPSRLRLAERGRVELLQAAANDLFDHDQGATDRVERKHSHRNLIGWPRAREIHREAHRRLRTAHEKIIADVPIWIGKELIDGKDR